MKRALAAAVFGGLVTFAVPQIATASARPVTPADHSTDHKANDCAGQPEAAPDSEPAPAPRQGDHEQDDDDGSTLF
jgi:hypothetical protein